jgi:DNA-binding response OmpR family regulator
MENTVPPAAHSLAGKKVLIVEDDKLLHDLLASRFSVLREQGVEVFPAFEALQGLAIAKEKKPDLVLLDLMLPVVSGFEFLEKLRADPLLKDTPVIVFSNLSGADDKARAAGLGVVDYIVKVGSSLDDIVVRVSRALNG